MVYMVGVAAKSSFHMSYPQNLGRKGLTGVFWLFSPFSYRIVRLGNDGLRIYFLDFLEFSLPKTAKKGATGGRREMIFALALL
jgi:hypothetical protein